MEMTALIPKTIHYCWFGGGELPELARRCIDSWRTFCPDYEIVEWNERNYNLDLYPYAREAYDSGKYAFVTDVVRLYAMAHYGGFYMDTDVEVVASLEPLRRYEAVSGFESETEIPTGLMGSIPQQPMINELLSEYECVHFLDDSGRMDLTTNVVRITNACSAYGFLPNNTFQVVNGFAFLPKDYLCPKDHATGRINRTKNTIAIHHFNGSWQSDEDRFAKSVAEKMPDLLPRRAVTAFARAAAVIRYRGINGVFSYAKERIASK